MDFVRKKRAYRFLPIGAAATFFLWAVAHFGVNDHSLYLDHPTHSDDPFYRPGPFPPHPPFGGIFPPPPPPGGPPTHTRPASKWSERADSVKDAFSHAYRGYTEYAGSQDELLPVSNGSVNNFNGWRLTMVDSLDTMLIMGLHEEFLQTVPLISNMTFALEEGSYAPFFETVIRYLGGLLSAYAISGEPILLTRADDLGAMLLPAFNTTHGLPMYAVNTVSGNTRAGWTGSNILWAEALSCQMEYKYLAHLTGRQEYFEKVEHIMDIMNEADVEDDQFATKWSVDTGKPTNNQFSVGAFADSAHEYLLKQWLMTAKSETKALSMYIRDVEAILNTLLYVTPNRNLLYRHEWAAQGLAYTCWLTYVDHETGLGPDIMYMTPMPVDDDHPRGGLWVDLIETWERQGRPGGVPPGLAAAPPQKDTLERDYKAIRPDYLLRPETVESIYIMWKTTGDDAWRERGWAIFQAIEKETRTAVGYASVSSVETSPARLKDEMPRYVTATSPGLKYLYLLFDDHDLIPLDRWVFNTEAHPLPVFEWTDWEKKRYGIPHSASAPVV
ncbi:glycoside hydrolase [Trametes elegans]|nr:glycoside hydrolase [Trametes elegans]